MKVGATTAVVLAFRPAYHAMRRWTAAAALALLYVLHQDFWFWREARPLVFGILPIGLFYHVAFTLSSSLVLWLLVVSAWPAHLEE